MKFSTPYSERIRTALDDFFPTLAKQSFKDECDVNTILNRASKTGLINHVNRFQGDYSDVTTASDYQTSVNAVMDAHDAFMELPSGIRKRFSNSPEEFLAFVHNPDNLDAMVDMGLAKAPAPPKPSPAPPEPPLVSKDNLI